MKAPAFDYERPVDVDGALRLLAEGGDDAKLIAGGQSLGPLLNLRLARPALLIDVRMLDEMREISASDNAVVLGAAVTHARIEDGNAPDPAGGLLRYVARGIAYRAVRNRGTIGGSLAHADPAADWVNLMALLDATLIVRSTAAERTIAAVDLVAGPLSTVLAADEMIVAVRIPKLSGSARVGWFKFNRKPGEFAEAICGIVDDPERDVRRLLVGVTESGSPHVADGAELLSAPPDARDGIITAAVAGAGFRCGTYKHQVRAVSLRRAMDALR
ncbi:MAG: FAD binding domain-containing protein [Burkholderiales bacterium]|nr:FAD binding domain-containing protein [Burkholderiales bacterium]